MSWGCRPLSPPLGIAVSLSPGGWGAGGAPHGSRGGRTVTVCNGIPSLAAAELAGKTLRKKGRWSREAEPVEAVARSALQPVSQNMGSLLLLLLPYPNVFGSERVSRSRLHSTAGALFSVASVFWGRWKRLRRTQLLRAAGGPCPWQAAGLSASKKQVNNNNKNLLFAIY